MILSTYHSSVSKPNFINLQSPTDNNCVESDTPAGAPSGVFVSSVISVSPWFRFRRAAHAGRYTSPKHSGRNQLVFHLSALLAHFPLSLFNSSNECPLLCNLSGWQVKAIFLPLSPLVNQAHLMPPVPYNTAFVRTALTRRRTTCRYASQSHFPKSTKNTD